MQKARAILAFCYGIKKVKQSCSKSFTILIIYGIIAVNTRNQNSMIDDTHREFVVGENELISYQNVTGE